MGVDTKATTQTSPHSPVILKFLKNTTTCFAFLPLNKKKHLLPVSDKNTTVDLHSIYHGMLYLTILIP